MPVRDKSIEQIVYTNGAGIKKKSLLAGHLPSLHKNTEQIWKIRESEARSKERS